MIEKQREWAKAFLLWTIISATFVAWVVNLQVDNLKSNLDSNAQSLHRIVSQRADQHDAHLTGLSALVSVQKEPLIDMLTNLAETIHRFYPRVASIDLVKLDQHSPTQVFTTRVTGMEQNTIASISTAAFASNGSLQIIPSQDGYFLVKRSPNSNAARYGLALWIDAAKLLENELHLNPETMVSLKTTQGISLYQSSANSTQGIFPLTLKFTQTLGSRSQPLALDVRRTITITDMVPWFIVVPFMIIFGGVIIAVRAYLRQRQQAKAAEERALLGEHEARIAQASRINGLGEMASGIAHELTQPLTAILSQSQAGERLVKLKPDDTETLSSALNAISQQAKRAGDILTRLRKWTAQDTVDNERVDLNQVAKGIRDLMKADLNARGIAIELSLHPTPLFVLGDTVQIEQVLFNLSRNGVEAMDGVQNGVLKITTSLEADYALMSVADNGTGIADGDMLNLKQPFFTTKTNGMGLGLSLCENIVERFHGELELKNRLEDGVIATVTLPIEKIN